MIDPGRRISVKGNPVGLVVRSPRGHQDVIDQSDSGIDPVDCDQPFARPLAPFGDVGDLDGDVVVGDNDGPSPGGEGDPRCRHAVVEVVERDVQHSPAQDDVVHDDKAAVAIGGGGKGRGELGLNAGVAGDGVAHHLGVAVVFQTESRPPSLRQDRIPDETDLKPAPRVRWCGDGIMG